MDVLDEKALRRDVVDPAITRLNGETIPGLQAAGAAIVAAAGEQVAVVVAGALAGLQATADKAVSDLRREVAALDGWTVEVGEIRIPAITIRLSAPKGEGK